MAKCFDLGFDTVILFTKVSKALVQQTINRMNDEFEEPINASNLLVWNAIKLDDSALNPYILSHKNIFVTKKEKANLNKLHNLFDNELKDKKILIVDDEADANSVTYIAPDEMAVISSSLSDLRQKAKGHIAYLQVTATPYSLYFQPDSAQFNEMGYSPLRPKQTFVLEAHPAYIGGKYYFEDSSNQNSPAAYLFHEISQDEMNYLNQKAKTKTTYNKKLLSNVLETDYIKGLRESIYLFLVGGAIRFIAEQNTHMQDLFIREYKCAFLMHTSQQKVVHKMQKDLVEKIINELSKKNQRRTKKYFFISNRKH